MVTRRCTQRQFLLKPTQLTTSIFIYCLAIAAEKTGMLVHSITVMGNHYHTQVTDPLGQLPVFMTHFHKLVAKCINASMGRWENVWSSEKPSVVKLETEDDVLDNLAYIACNPVSAGIVDEPEKWPGLIAYLPGQMLTAHRPDVFFRKDGDMPDTASLTLTRPPQFCNLSNDAYMKKLSEKIDRKKKEAYEEMKTTGRSFMGRAAIMRQNPTDSPNTFETRRNLNPQVACKSKWHRIEALQRIKSFLQEYKEALRKWKDGYRNVVFPAGTYAMRIHAGVCCAPG